MEKKKKNSDSGVTPLQLVIGILVILFGVPAVCIVSLIALIAGHLILGEASAYDHISQMQYWEMPPETEFVELTITDGSGGNTCAYHGRLKIASHLSADELTTFFRSRYGKYYYGGLEATTSGDKLDGKTIYGIFARQIWDCL